MACQQRVCMRMRNLGKPEQAPHKREVCAACLFVCLSVRTFMTRKNTKIE